MSESGFVGLWKLVSFKSTGPDGSPLHLFGPDPMGTIMYDAHGHMAVQIMQQDRPFFAQADWRAGTPEETKPAFDGYLAYFGRYEVNEDEGYVIHHMEGSMFPNWVGGELKRFYLLSANRLVLRTPPTLFGGVTGTSTLTWERVV